VDFDDELINAAFTYSLIILQLSDF